MIQKPLMKRSSYDGVARTLHWLTVFLISVQFVIGWLMDDVGRDTKVEGGIWWHLFVGGALILTIFIRVVWQVTHSPPPDRSSLWLRRVASATHFLLYAALIVTPLLGWANASSRGWVVRVFNIIPLPALTAKGSSFGHDMGDVHGVMAWVLFALIILHVSAALFHRFVLKDDVMSRMLK